MTVPNESETEWDRWLREDLTIQCKARWVQDLLESNCARVNAIANEMLKTQHAQWTALTNALALKVASSQTELQQLKETFGEAIKRGIIMSASPFIMTLNEKKPG